MKKDNEGKIITPSTAHPWPQEIRVAKILASAGHIVKFIPKTNNTCADIYLDGVIYEIKSPLSSLTNSLEHILKDATKQSSNIIFDSSRMKHSRDYNTRNFLISQAKSRKQIKHLIFITKKGEIIDISALI